ncbi:MAG: type II secretion system protein GspD [Deltaproteobacteria bacterium CG2_30_63_29]|nr:MAG: type II secretion system protein GspD [Deltaproteobacteria bacterium CG2_30_63_29]
MQKQLLLKIALSVTLWLSCAPLASAQDEAAPGDSEFEALEPQGKGSKPGVVKRKKPDDSKAAAAGDDGTGGGDAGETPGLDFGEKIDIDDNFGDDFQPISTPKNTRFTIDFRDADLSDVVKLMSAQTGRNFIIADSLRAGKKITIISPNPVSQVEAYRAFLSALEMNGLTVVKSGKFYKIVDINRGLKEPIEPLLPGQATPQDDSLVTRIIELEQVDIAAIKPVLDQLKSTSGVIVEYPPSNTVIITDTGNSINRMMKVIDRLERTDDDAEKIWIYQVQYADATEIQSLIGQIFDTSDGAPAAGANRRGGRQQQAQQQQAAAAAGAGGGDTDVVISQIVADERTNKLIIVANERSYERIKKLILKLDIELPDSGRINVVHLQNSDATEMAQTLSELSNQLQPTDPRRAPTPQQAAQPAVGAANAALLQGEVSVVANEPTNDLIIVASPRDYLAMKQVIKELDRPRKQVFVEAIILEVSIDRMRSLGVVLHGGDLTDTSEGPAIMAGRTSLNNLNSISPLPLFLDGAPGLLAAFIGPSIDLGGVPIPSMGVLLNALQTNTDVNVLSTPTLMTLDNEEAEISVGERIPFLTSSGSGLGGLGSALGSANLGGTDLSQAAGLLGGLGGLGSSQITRVDVALTLRIKPQINEAGEVRLEIEEEIEEVKPGGADLGGPTTRRRNLKTVVIVSDQQTVVLGGLIRDAETQSVSKVPLLGDIPVVGYLFRSTDTTIQKQNLILMLTPYVIEDDSDLDKIRERKEEERLDFLDYFGRKDLNYVKTVNFDKKHGLLEQLRQSVDSKESEISAVRDAQGILDLRQQDEGIELPEGLDDGYGGEGTPVTGANGQPATIAPVNPKTKQVKPVQEAN